jgi:phage I-like protein
MPPAMLKAAIEHFESVGPADDACDDVITRSPEAMPIAFADGAKPSVGHSTWNQIARVAEFNGHAQGPVKFTPEVFAEILRNFAANGNGEIPLDYEHTSERLPENAALVGVPAPGWVTKVEVRNGGRELWALFKWASVDAVRYVREGQYKYVSPAINFKSRDKVTGKPAGARLTSVALTNHPFIEGMQPLAADDRSRALDALLTPLARALNVSVAELAAAVAALKPAEQASTRSAHSWRSLVWPITTRASSSTVTAA